jgi:NitT/TauT family transport system ATP-binding protein
MGEGWRADRARCPRFCGTPARPSSLARFLPAVDVARQARHEITDAIELHAVRRSFSIGDHELVALEDLSLRVAQGSLVCVVGPNGSGKSTLLRIVDGLITADAGTVAVNSAPVAGPDPRVGLVFQEPRLLPWRTVMDNVTLPLALAGWNEERRVERGTQLIEQLGLDGFERAYPAQLSGGLAQRAGIARALALEPDVLLMDEPFSALDALTRDRLDEWLLTLWRRTQSTILLVTHSISEAVFLADRVVVLSSRPGRVVADIAVDIPRPRSIRDADAAAFTRAAMQVREALEAGSEAVGAAAA